VSGIFGDLSMTGCVLTSNSGELDVEPTERDKEHSREALYNLVMLLFTGLSALASIAALFVDGVQADTLLVFLTSPTGLIVIASAVTLSAIVAVAAWTVIRRRRYFNGFEISDIDDINLRALIESLARKQSEFSQELMHSDNGDRT
jgi:hypothetical protein